MPRHIRIQLTEAQRQELIQMRDGHPKPFVRERAAAVLKVADGALIQHVAERGLLKRHEPETVKGWLERYLAAGRSGWQIRRGRGRKPKFSPSDAGNAAVGTD